MSATHGRNPRPSGRGGRQLVLPRGQEGTEYRATIDHLIAAAASGALAVAPSDWNTGASLVLINSLDIGPAERERLDQAERWDREQMQALDKETAALHQAGLDWYFLGNPRLVNGRTLYWLNGVGMRTAYGDIRQPFGWYSLPELLAGKPLDDLNA